MLTNAQVEQYHQRGYVILPELFQVDEAARWKAQLQARLSASGAIDEPSGVRVWMCDEMDPLTGKHVRNERLVQALIDLIGPDVEFLSVKAVFKNGQTRFDSPWHQDWHYWQGSPKISVWIALDDATPENGCLRMVPGSHRSPLKMDDVDDGRGFNRRLAESSLANLEVETLPVNRGDAVFFHDLALHASCPNVNGEDRWTAIATYRNGSQLDSSTVWKRSFVLCGQSVNHV